MTDSVSTSAQVKRPRAEAPLYSAEELANLKARDNLTNIPHIAFVYLVLGATLATTVWSFHLTSAAGLGWWWNMPATVIAVLIVGAVQHQLGGIIHEATHYILFASRRMNEAVSDWLAAFAIYTSTHAFRLHHLSHHQFVNDPVRDSNFAQAKDSGHWLDFPLTHIEIVWAIIRQLNPVRLVSYIVARARYSALGVETNPYADVDRPGSPWTIRIGVMYAAGVPAIMISCLVNGYAAEALEALAMLWAATVTYYYVVPDDHYAASRLDPVISHRWTAISRITFMTIVYGALTATDAATGEPMWGYFALLWVLPLFTTFPLFMILREWVQHGNADRGRYTNSRVFIVNRLMRFAVFPFGMDYHLPHHLFASVPHYRLRELHALMQRDPEYRAKGQVVEGWSQRKAGGLPTIIDVLGPEHARAAAEVHVDDATLELADVNDRAAVARHAEASRNEAQAALSEEPISTPRS